MLTKSDVIQIINNDFHYLNTEFGVCKIGLFGSFAKDVQNINSDIDIIAEFDKPIGLKFVEFIDYLEQLFGRKTNVLTEAGITGIRNNDIAKSIWESIVYV